MNAAEIIAAAIEKLEAERHGEVEGEWLVDSVAECTCAGFDQYGHEAHQRGCGYEPLTSDPLIVTLHRTIDPQLAILQHGLQGARDQDNYNINAADEPQAVLDSIALARAVLGES